MTPAEIILKLRADNSRLVKERILEEAWQAGCTDFFLGAKYALDNSKVFGIKQIPIKQTSLPEDLEFLTFNQFINFLNDLVERNYTGHAARDVVISNMCAAPMFEWNLFYRQILLKDLDCGVSGVTINKVLKKCGKEAEKYMIPEYPYMRCSSHSSVKLHELPWDSGIFSQLKSDGQYCNLNIIDSDTIEMVSRNGKPTNLDEFQNIVTLAKNIFPDNSQVHGELVVYRDGVELPREIGNGLLNSVAKGGSFGIENTPVLVVWDIIPLSKAVPKGKYEEPYKDRLDKVTECLKNSNGDIKLVESKLVYSLTEAMDHYKEMLSLGKEGTILKLPEAIWKDGTSKQQLKFKVEAVIDLEIIGFNPGRGKNAATFGSIECCSSDKKLIVNVSGFTDKMREELNKQRDSLIGTIMAVKGNSVMTPSSPEGLYSVFLPRYAEFRQDKTVADSLEQIIQQFEDILQV